MFCNDYSSFFADYVRDCIWVQFPNEQGRPDIQNQEGILFDALAPVNLQIRPEGDLFYLAIYEGRLRRIQYDLPNTDPPKSPEPRAPLTMIRSGPETQESVPALRWRLDEEKRDSSKQR